MADAVSARRRVVLRTRPALFGLAVLLLLATPGHAELTVTASVDANAVALGESIRLTIEVAGAQNVAAPAIGDLDGFAVQYIGPSSQVSIVNGQVSARISHNYTLIARKTGSFTLGPFVIEHDGERHTTEPLAVQVLARGQAGTGAPPARGGVDISLQLEPLKSESYVGERIPVVIRLLVGNLRAELRENAPSLESDAFAADPFSDPQQRQQIIDGRRYSVVDYRTVVTPLRPGVLSLGPARLGLNVIVSRARRGNPFDDFFDLGERRPFDAQAEAVSVNVKPLPEEGKPADFAGAVGQFDFQLEVKPTELNAGDPVTVRTRISGTGNLDTVKAPLVPVDERFRTYEAQSVKGEEQAGARVFEQVMIPKDESVRELPAVRFSYFDPQSGQYRTITRGPVALAVHPAAVARAPQILGLPQPAAPEKPEEKLGRDIVYIKDTPGKLRPRGRRLHRGAVLWLTLIVPVLVFVAVSAYVRRRERFAADPRLVRFRQAGREVRHALDALAVQSADGTRFYDGLSAALRDYLGAKLDLPPGAVERERVLERLSGNGAAEEVRAEVCGFFDLIERVRYAPSASGSEERTRALALARSIVGRLERRRFAGPRGAAGVLLGVALAAALPVTASDEPKAPPGDVQAAFYEGNTAYKAGRFADAAAAYERVLSAGSESAAIYFNLGNAYFKQRRVGLAVANYERARRLAPRDPDVRANLAYAREAAEDEPEETPLWRRLALPLAERATADELAFGAAAVWIALWTALCLRLWLSAAARPLGRSAAVLATVFAFVLANFAARLGAVELRRSGAVVAPGTLAVRFEPSLAGTVHFQVKEGALLEITDQRESFFQVRRRDGRRGWVPADSILPL